MEKLIQSLHYKLNQLGLAEDRNRTPIPFINTYLNTKNNFVLPDTPNPFVLVIVSGTLRLLFATGIKDYQPGQYLISAIDSPLLGQAVSASEDFPFLALTIDFTVDEVISVMLDIDGDLPTKLFEAEKPSENQHSNELKLLEMILRLLNMSEHSVELSFMCKHLKRELIFNLIIGPFGKEFLQGTLNIQQAGDIYTINSWIKQNFKSTFMVEELAEQSNMSLSSFHQKFKATVGMGPLQCQKKLRLLESRRLMLNQALSVTDTAFEVGYESVSQFIRDYRKLFGLPPQKDVQVIRELYQIHE